MSLNRDTLLGVLGGAALGAAAAALIQRVAVSRASSAGAGAPATVRSTTDSGVSGAGGGAAVYESAKATNEYLLFHYAKDAELLPYAGGPASALQFPRRTAQMCVDAVREAGLPTRRALDIGCAVGAATFELAKVFDHVVGIDFSHAFVDAAILMQRLGHANVTRTDEAELTSPVTVCVDPDAPRERAEFKQGDACNLPESLGKFSVIHGSNLLCRLPDPERFIASLPSHLEAGGVVVLVSPYSWLTEYTPKDKWVGGYVDAKGGRVDSRAGLTAMMARHGFELVSAHDVPFLIREHARKFQWGCSDGTVWRLRR